MNKIQQWAAAIQAMEGWYPPSLSYPIGSSSYRNNNPGNLRYTSLTIELGATSKSFNGFAIFPNYSVGNAALVRFLELAALGRLRSYRRNNAPFTLHDFFQVYAPSADNNYPTAYAIYVASRLKVDVNIPITDLL